MQKRLTKSDNKAISGVLAGIAEYLDIDPTVIRIIYAVATVFSAGFPGVIIYLILLLVMPDPERWPER